MPFRYIGTVQPVRPLGRRPSRWCPALLAVVAVLATACSAKKSATVAPPTAGTSATATVTATASQPSPSPQLAGAANMQQLINRAVQEFNDYQRLTSEGKLAEAGKKLEEHKRTLEELRKATSKPQ